MNTAWTDLQFSYELTLTGTSLRFSKRLRFGGHLPTGAMDLAASAVRGAGGSPQEGEESLSVNLQEMRSAVVKRRPYRGYSAFRTPVVVFSGMATAIPAALWADRDGWSVTDWGWIIAGFLVGSLAVGELLARLFPHRTLLLEFVGGGRWIGIDVHTMPDLERKELVTLIQSTLDR